MLDAYKDFKFLRLDKLQGVSENRTKFYMW